MTTPAEQARKYATSCEMVKYALRQTKDGIVVSFVVHPNDIPAALQISHIGSRWMAALVQINDDETPVKQPKDPAPSIQSVSLAPAKRDWRELQPQQQAGIRCCEPIFTAFLKETYPIEWREVSDAAECVRLICEVNSRVELGTNHKARMIWHQLDEKFVAWKALENA